jgi:hypothetical protein
MSKHMTFKFIRNATCRRIVREANVEHICYMSKKSSGLFKLSQPFFVIWV